MKYAVVGGGLTGLVAARRLHQLAPDAEITLYEARERLGGKIHTGSIGGTLVEFGADSFLVRDPWALDLCRSLGIEDELIEPAVYGAQVLLGGELKPLPVGFLRGVPPDLRSALGSGLLTPLGALRAGIDVVWPKRLSGPDTSFGSFVRQRFGSQVLDRLVDPVLAGTRAGIPEEISLAAAAPEIDRIAREHRSVMRGLKRLRRAGSIEGGAPPFRSLRGGLERLIDAIRDDLGDVKLEGATKVESIVRDETGYRISTSAGNTSVDGAILTTPPFVTAAILDQVAPDAVPLLNSIHYASVAGVVLVYETKAVRLPTGSGLLVPSAERRSLSACTWFSVKWPQHASSDGHMVIRAFIGRAAEQRVLERTDEELIQIATGELSTILGIEAKPEDVDVVRWERSLPQYAVGHLDTVARIDKALASNHVYVAGAGYRGSGIPDCIKQGTSAAEALVAGR